MYAQGRCQQGVNGAHIGLGGNGSECKTFDAILSYSSSGQLIRVQCEVGSGRGRWVAGGQKR